MDHVQKIRHTVDALFGGGTAARLPRNLDIELSKRTGRVRTVSSDGRLLFTLRTDGGLAISIYCAHLFLKARYFRRNCLEVNVDARPFVERGYSVFARHVAWCGEMVRIGSEVPVLYGDTVIAVGRATLSAGMIRDLGRGVAVKIRYSLKSREGDPSP